MTRPPWIMCAKHRAKDGTEKRFLASTEWIPWMNEWAAFCVPWLLHCVWPLPPANPAFLHSFQPSIELLQKLFVDQKLKILVTRLKTFQSIGSPRCDWILHAFWLHFGCVLTEFLIFGWILAALWLNFGCIWTAFCLHFDCISATFRLHFDCILAAFWLHFDWILTEFWLHFDCILTEIWLLFSREKSERSNTLATWLILKKIVL